MKQAGHIRGPMIIKHAMRISSLFAVIILFSLAGAFSDSWAYIDEECRACHGTGGHESRLTISLDTYGASVHGRNGIACGDCHNDILDEGHEAEEGIMRVDCHQCHDQINRHGGKTGILHRPKCYDCHGTHDILEKERRDSAVHGDQLTTTCRKCHAAECESDKRFFLLPAFSMATHVKQNFSKTYDKSHCLGCHQASAAHGEGSLIHEDDCFRCHLRDGKNDTLLGRFHKKMEMKNQPGVFVAGLLNELIVLALLFCGLLFVVQWFVLKRKGSE